MTTHTPIHVIGAGIAGLAAAITAAEGGAPVVVHEASDALGGRARSGAGPSGVTLGPHVLYANGAVVRFLEADGIRRAIRLKLPRAGRVAGLDGHGTHGPVRLAGLVRALALPRSAPADRRFDEWAHDTFNARDAED